MDAFIPLLMLGIGGAAGAILMQLFGLRHAVAKSKFDALFIEKELLAGKVAELNNHNAQTNERLEATHTELRQSRDQVVRLQTEARAFEQKLEEHRADVARTEEKSREAFQNLATRIFDAQADKFNKTSKEKLDVLLQPLQKQLEDFEKQVNENVKEQYSLKKEIANIVLVNQKMSQETANLTNALKGNSKTQGDWGEFVLENILEASGLRAGDDYIVQGSFKNEDGKVLRPDVIVRLPEKKHIIVDSKVSLLHYEAYCAAEEDGTRVRCLRDYLASVRNHVMELESRGYQAIEALGTPDFVLMFLPTEGAYALALQQDKELHHFAWGRKIILVCPATLLATLRTVASIWRLELQNQNAMEIARQGGALYEKIAGFVEDMRKIGAHMSKTQEVYDNALNKLSRGKGNILSRVEKLKKLGATTQTSLSLTGEDEDELLLENNDVSSPPEKVA